MSTSDNTVQEDLFALRAAFAGIDVLLRKATRILATKQRFSVVAFTLWRVEAEKHWTSVLDVQKRRRGVALDKQVQLVGTRKMNAERGLEQYLIESKLCEEKESHDLAAAIDRKKQAARPARPAAPSRKPSPLRPEKQKKTSLKTANRFQDAPEAGNPGDGAVHRAEVQREAAPSRQVQQPAESRPKPNMHWIGLRWTEIRGEAHVVTPVKLTFCGLGASGGSRGYSAPVCYECGAFARMEPGLRNGQLPTRVAEAIKRWEATQSKRRSGHSSSVRSVSAGLPSMGKRYS